jgi:hypothetical protein
MNPLFYVGIALVVGGIAVTVCAALFATEGYEDEDGFHAIRRKDQPGQSPRTKDAPIPPFFSPR